MENASNYVADWPLMRDDDPRVMTTLFHPSRVQLRKVANIERYKRSAISRRSNKL
jgi:hypothetical protein